MKKLLIILLVSTCSACAPLWQSKPQIAAEDQWEIRQNSLQKLENWSFRGRTVITQDKEGWNAGVSWIQQGENFQIRLSGPFAQGAVELEGDTEQVTLTTSEGKTYLAETPEALLFEVMGWLLPVSALRDWVRGLPFTESEMTGRQLDEQGRLTSLEQAGWQIEFIRYMPFEGLDVPAKIFIKHPDLNIRLVVSSWNTP